MRLPLKKVLSWNAEDLDPEERLEILVDIVSSIMNMKLEHLLEKEYSIEETIEILRRTIVEGKTFR